MLYALIGFGYFDIKVCTFLQNLYFHSQVSRTVLFSNVFTYLQTKKHYWNQVLQYCICHICQTTWSIYFPCPYLEHDCIVFQYYPFERSKSDLHFHFTLLNLVTQFTGNKSTSRSEADLMPICFHYLIITLHVEVWCRPSTFHFNNTFFKLILCNNNTPVKTIKI